MNRFSISSSALPWALTVAAAVGACIYYTATSSEPEKAIDGEGSKLVTVKVSKKPKKELDGRASKFVESTEDVRIERAPPRSARRIHQVSHEDNIEMCYPTFGLDQAQADDALREHAGSLIFDGGFDVQGRCDCMALSSHAICEDFQDMAIGHGVGKAHTIFAGIYDGHCGSMTSMALRDTLLPYVSWCLSQLEKSSTDKAIDEAIKDAFLKMDARIMGPAERCARSEDLPQCSAEAIMTLAPAMTGSGALVAAFDADTSTLRVALTGDARAVLGRWCPKKNAHTMDALTEDQNGFNAKEISRLDKEHPGEIDRIINRQSGKLMSSCVTRSFGDHRWKWPGDLVQSVAERFFGYDRLSGDYPTPSYLTASPEVTTRKVRPKDFLILASGGLWNHISRETAVECVSRWVAAKRTGGPEEVQEVETVFPLVGPYSYPTWGTSPQYFAIEDMDNAAICLAKNALGGSRRNMFRGMMSLVSPFSHLAREDISIQVMFFEDPHLDPAG